MITITAEPIVFTLYIWDKFIVRTNLVDLQEFELSGLHCNYLWNNPTPKCIQHVYKWVCMNINSSYINFGFYIIAIGVPVMLAYVYGVVPYSLCRGGTCGVKNDGGTFTFDFGSSTEENAGKLLNHSLETELWFGFLSNAVWVWFSILHKISLFCIRICLSNRFISNKWCKDNV